MMKKCINKNCKHYNDTGVEIKIGGHIVLFPPDPNNCALFENVEECEYHDILEPPTSEFHKNNRALKIIDSEEKQIKNQLKGIA